MSDETTSDQPSPATPGSAGAASSNGGSAIPGNPQFTGEAVLPGALQIASSLSPDKQACSVLFSNLMAFFAERGLLVETRIATVSLPLQNMEEETRVTQDVRGFVWTRGNARAVLIIQAAGKTTVVDPLQSCLKGSEIPEPEGPVKEARERAWEKIKKIPASNRSEAGDDFVCRVDGIVPAGTGAGYSVSFILLVERDTDEDGNDALLTIDSLDVEIRRAAPAVSENVL